jgi:hypothetical protein
LACLFDFVSIHFVCLLVEAAVMGLRLIGRTSLLRVSLLGRWRRTAVDATLLSSSGHSQCFPILCRRHNA